MVIDFTIMVNKMDVIKKDLENIKERVVKLERYRDEDLKIINEHNTNLATIILKLDNITTQLATITNNWKEAINRSNSRNEEERANINNRINALEKNVDKLNAKLESETKTLENTLDERTILKDSNNYQKYIFEIIKYVVLAILGVVVGKWLI